MPILKHRSTQVHYYFLVKVNNIHLILYDTKMNFIFNLGTNNALLKSTGKSRCLQKKPITTRFLKKKVIEV